MLNISKLAEWLKEKTEWQETPVPLTDKNYINMVIDGIERLFVDTGRSEQYDEEKYVTVTEEEPEGIEEPESSFEESETITYYGYDAVFPLDERRYIQICAEINFFSKVQSDVNNAFGYSTDAITVTNADKPYTNLKDTIDKLDNERRIIYYKMVRYTLGVS
jgi:hypothetical protein